MNKREQVGLAFERKCQRYLMDLCPTDLLHCNCWFHQKHSKRMSPDIYIVRSDTVLVFECKTKENPTAYEQLGKYTRLLSTLHSRPAYGIQLVKVAVDPNTQHISNLRDWLANPTNDRVVHIV